jgi:hypothetical protein
MTQMVDTERLLRERIERLEVALRAIDTSHSLPPHFDPAEWWKHLASKRREIARVALAYEDDDSFFVSLGGPYSDPSCPPDTDNH